MTATSSDTSSSSALAVRASSALQQNGERYDWAALLRAGSGVCEMLLGQGTAPAFDALVGWDFGGANTWSVTKLVGIRKFMKGFYEGPPRGEGPAPFIQGYNVKVRQNGDLEPHVVKPSEEKPARFGFYRVHRVVPGARDSRYPNALLLDYLRGGNGFFGPPICDYLVQVYPDDPDLLLGKAYLAVGFLRIPMGFFVLKRLREHAFAG